MKQMIMTSSPHVRSEDSTQTIMGDVLIALLPSLVVSVFTFGARSLLLTAVSVCSCVLFEWGYQKLMHKPVTIWDLSACVTGVLLAFNLPVSVPLWLPVIGALFAIVVVKQLYGGIGKNVFNPALAARVFLMLSWPAQMTMWTAPGAKLPLFGNVVDAVTTATPLGMLKESGTVGISYTYMLLGYTGGCLGETSALALLVGFAYLIYRRVIWIRIPVAYIGTVAVLSFLFPQYGLGRGEFLLTSILSGGLMLGALFMATDYTTSPVTAGGRWIYGVGCGILTVVIRWFGAYAEGVSFAILVMNALVWMIDMKFKPKRYGTYRRDQFREMVGIHLSRREKGQTPEQGEKKE